jgi:hypothetical protein
VFHRRHAPRDEADAVRGRDIHWKHWSTTHAVGKGTATFTMVGPTPMDVRLDRVRHVCGHKVFSRATFDFPKLGISNSHSPLQACH